jgi:putative tryptophan/tyrosine transport system substrate-binding protein
MSVQHIKRREFIAGLGGAAAWPLVARAQQPAGMPRIGVLTAFAESDTEAQANITAFRQSLEKVGWIEGRNLAIDYRWGDADPERIRNYAII